MTADATLFHELHSLFMAELREERVRTESNAAISANAVVRILKATGSTYTRYLRGERRAPHWVVQGYAEAWAATGRKLYLVTAEVDRPPMSGNRGLCPRCRLGTDSDGDGDCAVCAHWSDARVSRHLRNEAEFKALGGRRPRAEPMGAHHSLCRMAGITPDACTQCEVLRDHDRFVEAAGAAPAVIGYVCDDEIRRLVREVAGYSHAADPFARDLLAMLDIFDEARAEARAIEALIDDATANPDSEDVALLAEARVLLAASRHPDHGEIVRARAMLVFFDPAPAGLAGRSR